MSTRAVDVVAEARAFVCDLLDDLGPRLVSRAGDAAVEVKADGSLVTPADVETDEAIARAVGEAFPGHALVSEELDTTYRGEEWCWVVDPIDGTTNFVRGLPSWCVSIALTHDGRPVLGCVDAPALGHRYLAVAGEGATVDGRPLSVRDVDWDDHARLRNTLLMVSSGVGKHYVLDLPLRPRALGSAALHVCEVAAGVAVASLHTSPKLWDIAAGLLLLEEAGGAVMPVHLDPPFPMTGGTDYAVNPFRFVAAASDGSARRVLEGIEPREHIREFLLPGD